LLQHLLVYRLCKAEVCYNQHESNVRKGREVRAIQADRRETLTTRIVPQMAFSSPAVSGKRPLELREDTAQAKSLHAAASRMGSLLRATLERYFAGWYPCCTDVRHEYGNRQEAASATEPIGVPLRRGSAAASRTSTGWR
jgi:hypothetical protein